MRGVYSVTASRSAGAASAVRKGQTKKIALIPFRLPRRVPGMEKVAAHDLDAAG